MVPRKAPTPLGPSEPGFADRIANAIRVGRKPE
jgi:hypothetical protein